MNEEEHKLGIRASSTRQVFFNETKFLLKTCYQIEETDLKLQ
jgi:hypothetical protein